MKRKHILYLAVLLAFVLAVGIVKYVVWDKPDSVNISLKTPIRRLDAKTVIDLINDADKHIIQAEQIIEIEGIVKKISYLNNRITILLGSDDKDNAFVICDMDSNQSEEVKKLSINDTIKLKGVFKGFLEDAIFLNCIITE
ncbi:hypothetical protein MHTCC0001_30420 [Flavobacteriaceae bacterium MHTCC 0001]